MLISIEGLTLNHIRHISPLIQLNLQLNVPDGLIAIDVNWGIIRLQLDLSIITYM